MPLPDRALTAALAECGGHALLFDCGEGTQAAARRAGVNLMKLDAICLTHYHATISSACRACCRHWAVRAGSAR